MFKASNNWSTQQVCCTYEYEIMASVVLCEINSTHYPTQTNQTTTQPKQTNPKPNPDTTLLRSSHIIIVNICTAVQEIRPSRWVSKSWNRHFKSVVKELPRAFLFVFLLIIWIKKMCNLFFLSKSHTISNTHISPVGNTPYRKPHNTRTMCTIPLQSILEAGLHSRQSFLVRLTNQFDAFFNPKNAPETKATNK